MFQWIKSMYSLLYINIMIEQEEGNNNNKNNSFCMNLMMEIAAKIKKAKINTHTHKPYTEQ